MISSPLNKLFNTLLGNTHHCHVRLENGHGHNGYTSCLTIFFLQEFYQKERSQHISIDIGSLGPPVPTEYWEINVEIRAWQNPILCSANTQALNTYQRACETLKHVTSEVPLGGWALGS